VKTNRKRTRRDRDSYATVPQIVRRFKEMLCDGFGLIPQCPTDAMISNLRQAFFLIHQEQKFWDGLYELCEAKRHVQIVSAVVKQTIHRSGR